MNSLAWVIYLRNCLLLVFFKKLAVTLYLIQQSVADLPAAEKKVGSQSEMCIS